jgi:hypothetical protein
VDEAVDVKPMPEVIVVDVDTGAGADVVDVAVAGACAVAFTAVELNVICGFEEASDLTKVALVSVDAAPSPLQSSVCALDAGYSERFVDVEESAVLRSAAVSVSEVSEQL